MDTVSSSFFVFFWGWKFQWKNLLSKENLVLAMRNYLWESCFWAWNNSDIVSFLLLLLYLVARGGHTRLWWNVWKCIFKGNLFEELTLWKDLFWTYFLYLEDFRLGIPLWGLNFGLFGGILQLIFFRAAAVMIFLWSVNARSQAWAFLPPCLPSVLPPTLNATSNHQNIWFFVTIYQ